MNHILFTTLTVVAFIGYTVGFPSSNILGVRVQHSKVIEVLFNEVGNNDEQYPELQRSLEDTTSYSESKSTFGDDPVSNTPKFFDMSQEEGEIPIFEVDTRFTMEDQEEEKNVSSLLKKKKILDRALLTG